jgi:predicted ATPase/DNA-binding SARP family transcriptional activator
LATGSWFTVLGSVRGWQAGSELDVGSPQQRAVLAALLLRHGTPVSVEDMIDALWDEDVPGAAAGTVRTYISRLRRVLESDTAAGPVIRSVAGGYQLDLSAEELDVTVFRRHLADGERARQAGDVATWRAELVNGLELWHGTPLAGLPGPFASRQRTILERLGMSAQTARLRAELDLGELDRVLPELVALVDEHPLDEQLRNLLITGLYRAGRQADALAAYQDIRSLLASELGIDPGPALQALHERILRADPALMPAAAHPGHRPSPRSLDNLPAQASSFIGREGELAEVRELVARARLVTLTGAGGVGKTRLGLQVAGGLLDSAGDGVWFAELAPLSDQDLVAVTVAGVLGVPLDPSRPVLDKVVEAVGERSLLLLLDNCEHVIAACAELADGLLRGCPNITLLATSREPLGISGEWVYRVPSMGVPAAGAAAGVIRASEAVRLLADRAAAQGVPLAWDEEAAQVAGRITRRLDGMPLAIELAAARLRVLPAVELESRLGERFALLTGGSRAGLPRQQTLRAMVDWSWDLLTGAERAMLARLSVFAGGFDLAAAAAIATGPDVPAAEVLGLLGSLVDKSLVQFGDTGAGPGRYRLLETVRQYAAGQLEALGPEVAEAARTAHRDYYLVLAEDADVQLKGADQAAWLDRLDAELGNLRAAIAFSLTQPDPEPGLRLATPLRVYWQRWGLSSEGAEVLRALLNSPGAQEATPLRARALAEAAHLLGQTSGYTTAGEYSQEALAIARASGDDSLIAELLQTHAWILVRQGQQDAALPLIERGLSLARILGRTHLTARLLITRAHAIYIAGDHVGAARDAAETLRLFRQVGDRIQMAVTLGNLGNYELAAGDLDAARRHLTESLDIARGFNDQFAIWGETFNLGLAEYLSGSLGAAEALFTESYVLARRGAMRSQVAYALIGLALTGHGRADPGWSARLHGTAEQAFADLGLAIEPLEGRLAELDRQRLRAALGDGTFAAEYAAGRTLSPLQVMAT